MAFDMTGTRRMDTHALRAPDRAVDRPRGGAGRLHAADRAGGRRRLAQFLCRRAGRNEEVAAARRRPLGHRRPAGRRHRNLRRRPQGRQRRGALGAPPLCRGARQRPDDDLRPRRRRPQDRGDRDDGRPRHRRTQELLNAAIPGNDIHVKTVADSIILTGSVASAGEAQKALDIASGFVGYLGAGRRRRARGDAAARRRGASSSSVAPSAHAR